MQKERSASTSGVTTRKPNGGLFRRVTPITPQQAFEAVQLGDSSSIVNLLHTGAHPDSITTSNGATALTVAIINQNCILAEQLLELGANPNLSRDPSYLHLAVARADNRHTLDILEALLRAGANPNAKEGHYSRSPLHQAILLGRVGAAKKLIGSGADVNAIDGRAQTPLSLALQQPPFLREAFCCLLNSAGADMSLLSASSQRVKNAPPSPLDLAEGEGDGERALAQAKPKSGKRAWSAPRSLSAGRPRSLACKRVSEMARAIEAQELLFIAECLGSSDSQIVS